MNTKPKFVDIHGLLASGIFPDGRAPSIRTVREWTRRRLIPYSKIGQFVFYDPEEVLDHLQHKLKVKPRG